MIGTPRISLSAPRFRLFSAVGILLAIGFLGSACRDADRNGLLYGKPQADGEAPILVIGMDGLEWDILLPLLHQGELPNMARMMDRGAFGYLETLHPTWSPRIWTSVATGKNPEDHGVLDFVHYAEDRTPISLYTSEDRKVKAWWNILSEAGIPNDTIGWWMTFPVEPVDGLMVAQTNAPVGGDGPSKGLLRDGVPAQVFPVSREGEVFNLMAQAEESLDETIAGIFGTPDLFSDEAQERWEDCRWAFRADSTYLKIALDCAKRGPAPMTAVYFGGTDVVGHRFFAAYQPGDYDLRSDSDEVRVFADVIPNYYRYMDSVLGDLVEAWPADTTFFVLSDHGMVSQREEVAKRGGLHAKRNDGKLNLTHTGGHGRGEAGVLFAAGPLILDLSESGPASLSSNELPTIGGVLDLCPTLLQIFGIPVGRDMAGGVWREMLAKSVTELPWIATHDDEAWRMARPHTGIQPTDSSGRIDQLGDLGYLDEDK
jgi:hypothetical protein